MIIQEAQSPAFLKDGGIMGDLIRKKDWNTTPLGLPGTWPQSLRTTVNLLLNSKFPMFVWWGEDLTTIYNDAYIIIAGEKHPDLLGKSGKAGWSEIWDDLGPLVDRVFQGTATWSDDQVLYMNRHGYIEETYFTFSYSPVMDESGQVGGLFCACIETTEKVMANRKIIESERNLRNTILQSPVAMSILKGPSFTVEIANDRMFELWGRGAEEILHRPIFDGLPEARHKGLEEVLLNVYKTGEKFIANERPVPLPRKGGVENVYLNFVYEPFREGDSTISGILVVATDVTEQVIARRKVEESEARTRLAAAAAHLGTYDIDLVHQEIAYSSRLKEIFGIEDGQPITHRLLIDGVHPDDMIIRAKAHELALKTGELFYEARVNLPNNDLRWIRLNGKYIFENGQPVSLVGTVMDITNERKAAEFLEQKIEERTSELTQLNEQLKQFTYAASHDLQEPLRKITYFMDRLLAKIGPTLDEDDKRITDRISKTTERMRVLIDDLLAYSNTSLGITGFREVDLSAVVQDVLDDMEATIIENGASVVYEDLPRINGDARQLRQMFQNLLSNALKYHKQDEGSRVHIGVTLVKSADISNIQVENKDATYYKIQITDNGIGFKNEDASRIFQLFQRLHGRSEYAGTGVGLAIVQKVVENHKGYIWAESEPGKGARFTILLPASLQ
ncbi:MAG TPA: ATP-binding protein [Flavisolibacter sp.]|nr:ATP-binding protein [Flavisolibacter sp.]